MSIASRESNTLYSKPNKRTVGRSNPFDFEELRAYQRAAYQRGRTAEPTEEEVKAAADELAAWNFDVAMNSGTTIHGAAADFSSRSFELLAKRVLTAARKTVTESREVEGNENGEI